MAVKTIDTDVLLTLCEINGYEEFSRELEKLITLKYGLFSFPMYQIMSGHDILGYETFKEFVKKYHNIIDTINKNKSLYKMIVCKYQRDSKFLKDNAIDYFWNYLQKHKSNLKTIREVVKRIKSLNIYAISYDEDKDFTKDLYLFPKTRIVDFSFLENMESVLTYEETSYETSSSVYRIILKFFSSKNNISRYDREIELNSLIFNPDRLPREISFETTVLPIKKLFEENEEKSEEVKSYIDLSMSIDKLTNDYEDLKDMLGSIKSIKESEKAKEILSNRLREIEDLKETRQNFELDSTVDKNILEKQFENYKKKNVSNYKK